MSDFSMQPAHPLRACIRCDSQAGPFVDLAHHVEIPIADSPDRPLVLCGLCSTQVAHAIGCLDRNQTQGIRAELEAAREDLAGVRAELVKAQANQNIVVPLGDALQALGLVPDSTVAPGI
jgi:hypothetical protein